MIFCECGKATPARVDLKRSFFPQFCCSSSATCLVCLYCRISLLCLCVCSTVSVKKTKKTKQNKQNETNRTSREPASRRAVMSLWTRRVTFFMLSLCVCLCACCGLSTACDVPLCSTRNFNETTDCADINPVTCVVNTGALIGL